MYDAINLPDFSRVGVFNRNFTYVCNVWKTLITRVLDVKLSIELNDYWTLNSILFEMSLRITIIIYKYYTHNKNFKAKHYCLPLLIICFKKRKTPRTILWYLYQQNKCRLYLFWFYKWILIVLKDLTKNPFVRENYRNKKLRVLSTVKSNT